ncbi:MAG: hypothetical protein R6V03_10155 [Kiritimatiellia bacterium]
MITIMMAEIFIEAGLLCAILYFVARHEADYSFAKVAMVAAGISVGSLIIHAVTDAHVPDNLKWTLYIADVAFAALMIMTFCWVSAAKSVIVIVIFSSFHLAAQAGVKALDKRMQKATAPVMTMTSERAEIMKEIQKEIIMQGNRAAKSWKPKHTPPPCRIPEPTPAPETNSPDVTEKPPQKPQIQMPAAPAAARSPEPHEEPPGEIEEKAGEEDETVSSGWAEARKTIDITGIVKGSGGKYAALINSSVTEQGDVVSVRHEGKLYTWRVGKIENNGLELTPVGVRE